VADSWPWPRRARASSSWRDARPTSRDAPACPEEPRSGCSRAPTRQKDARVSLKRVQDRSEDGRVRQEDASLSLARAQTNLERTRVSERDASLCEARAQTNLERTRVSERDASLCEARARLCLRDARASERDAPIPRDRYRLDKREGPPRLNGWTLSLGGVPFVSREGTVGAREAAEVRTREALRQRAARVGGRDGSSSLVAGAVSRRVSSYVVDKPPDPHRNGKGLTASRRRCAT